MGNSKVIGKIKVVNGKIQKEPKPSKQQKLPKGNTSVFEQVSAEKIDTPNVDITKPTVMTPHKNVNVKSPKQIGLKYKWLKWGGLALVALVGLGTLFQGCKKYYNDNVNKVIQADESPCDSTENKLVEANSKRISENLYNDQTNLIGVDEAELGIIRFFKGVGGYISGLLDKPKEKVDTQDNIIEEAMTPELSHKLDSIIAVRKHNNINYNKSAAELIDYFDARSREQIPSYDQIVKNSAENSKYTTGLLGVSDTEQKQEIGTQITLKGADKKDENKQNVESKKPLLTSNTDNSQSKKLAKTDNEKKTVKQSNQLSEQKNTSAKTDTDKEKKISKEYVIVERGDCPWNIIKRDLRKNPEKYARIKVALANKLGHEPSENMIISKALEEIDIGRKTKTKKQNLDIGMQGDTIKFSPLIHKVA